MVPVREIFILHRNIRIILVIFSTVGRELLVALSRRETSNITLRLTAEPATVFTETGFQVLSLDMVRRQSGDQEASRAAPSPDAISVEEEFLFHPEVPKPVRNEIFKTILVTTLLRFNVYSGFPRCFVCIHIYIYVYVYLPHGTPHVKGHDI